MSGDRVIATVEDVESIRDDIVEVHDGWYSSGCIDWEDFLDRLEARGYELPDGPEAMLSPPVKRIKAIVRELRRAAS